MCLSGILWLRYGSVILTNVGAGIGAIMSKRGTVYILGAGASHISPAPEAKLPLQKGFFACIVAPGFVHREMILESLKEKPCRDWLIRNGYGGPHDPNSRLTNDLNINLVSCPRNKL